MASHRVWRYLLFNLLALLWAGALVAQTPSTYTLKLKDGRTLTYVGAFEVVEGRLVFEQPNGEKASLAADLVDFEASLQLRESAHLATIKSAAPPLDTDEPGDQSSLAEQVETYQRSQGVTPKQGSGPVAFTDQNKGLTRANPFGLAGLLGEDPTQVPRHLTQRLSDRVSHRGDAGPKIWAGLGLVVGLLAAVAWVYVLSQSFGYKPGWGVSLVCSLILALTVAVLVPSPRWSFLGGLGLALVHYALVVAYVFAWGHGKRALLVGSLLGPFVWLAATWVWLS